MRTLFLKTTGVTQSKKILWR